MHVSPDMEMFEHFCGLDNTQVFVCVQIWLQRDFVFALILHGYSLVWCQCSGKQPMTNMRILWLSYECQASCWMLEAVFLSSIDKKISGFSMCMCFLLNLGIDSFYSLISDNSEEFSIYPHGVVSAITELFFKKI